jgi:hypothetical protein
MALEMNDLMMLRGLDKEGLSPYEQYKVGHMQSKSHTGGVAIAGLTVGVVGAVAGITAWIFGPTYANAKSNQAKEAAIAAKELANVQIAASQRQIDQLTTLFAAERSERIAGDFTLNQTITDTVSGQQASTLTAQQAAELSAIQTATNTVTAGLMTGQYSQNPQKVAIYRDAQACGCPGCGCNG